MRPRDGQRQGRGEQRVVRGRWINYTAHLQHVNKMVMEDEYTVLVCYSSDHFCLRRAKLQTYHIQLTWPKEGGPPRYQQFLNLEKSPKAKPITTNKLSAPVQYSTSTTQYQTHHHPTQFVGSFEKRLPRRRKKKETNARNSARVGGTHEESPVKEKAH